MKDTMGRIFVWISLVAITGGTTAYGQSATPAATTTPADIMKLPATGRLARGLPADLVVLRARGYSELLSRRQADRVVLRDGKAIDPTLPDYRELDPIVGL